MDFIADKVRVLCAKLRKMSEEKLCSIDNTEIAPCDYKNGKNAPDADTKFTPFKSGDRVCGKDKHFWVKINFETPKKIKGKKVCFSLHTGRENEWDATNPQCLVYLNGKIVQGLDVNHTDLLLEFDKKYEMLIYYYVGMIDKYTEIIPELKLIDEKIKELYYDVRVPYEAALCFKKTDDNFITIMKYLDNTLRKVNFLVPGSDEFYKSVDDALCYIKSEFYGKICGKSNATVNCIGHTHIDVAWMWTVAQTREKAQRSFSTVLSYMEQYPEYKFMSSQPQLYEFVKEDAPELYERIKKAVKNKVWEPEGAMWLEADCNITSGESLIRQILFGKRFFKNEFGVDNKTVWLPDVFGYSAAMPQIMKKSGIEYFVTSKISWNETNTMPYDTFYWQGIDGSEIFTYFITAQDLPENGEKVNFTTYVGNITPRQVIGTWERYNQKEYNNETLITFGYGDGGGGPTLDMLEYQRRLAYGIPGIPKTQIGFAYDFLNRVKENFDKNAEQIGFVPRWVGELYLELHRGTYTSIAKNKRNNRKCEFLYQKLETLCVADKLIFNEEYPQVQINAAWKNILLNQFHDIIPGSSIYEVYEVTDSEYKKLINDGSETVKNKLLLISSSIKTDGGVFVYNPNGFNCDTVFDFDGKKVFAKNIAPLGYTVVKEFNDKNSITFDDGILNTPFYEIKFNENADIVMLYDKENKREVNSGIFNEFEIFEDNPRSWDAWEITSYYTNKKYHINNVKSITAKSCGSAFCITVVREFLESVIKQNIYVYENIRRIDFETEIDWKQEHQLMKIAFPVNVHATYATYDIQFGNITRPTHYNTSWDKAKFEVCAHKWADISEDNYGLALLNDCKYGYSAEGNVLKLTVLKSATYPNAMADKEVHRFTYSILPHSGTFKSAHVINESYIVNQPLSAVNIGKQNGTLPETYSLVKCNAENVFVETVKKAEDSDDIIIRLYECFDRKTDVTLDFGFDFESAYICDMTEQNDVAVNADAKSINLCINNFEIVTLKIKGAQTNYNK